MLVNFTIDSLDVRIGSYAELSRSYWFSQALPDWELFQETAAYGQVLPVSIPGLGDFSLLPSGKAPYAFVLVNPTIASIYLLHPRNWAKLADTGVLYVNFRSQFLQGRSQDDLWHSLRYLWDVFTGGSNASPWFRVSRADLACDVAGRSVGWEDLQAFVGRSRIRDAFVGEVAALASAAEPLGSAPGLAAAPQTDNKGGAKYLGAIPSPQDYENEANSLSRAVFTGSGLQTIYFGRFSSPLYARVYNKALSLDVQGKQYLRPIWKENGWDGESPVWRCEFSLSGDFLRNAGTVLSESDSKEFISHDFRSLSLFFEHIPRFWEYLTGDWLTHRDLSESDSNLSRAPVSSWWRVFQSAATNSSDLVLRRGSPPAVVDDYQLSRQIEGCVLTLTAARVGEFPSPERVYSVIRDLIDYAYHPDFPSQVNDRRSRLGVDSRSASWFDTEESRASLETYLDSQFSTDIRRLAMASGLGS